MKFLYLSNSRMPTEKAHGIQTMQMAKAFSEAISVGELMDFELVIPRRLNTIRDDLFAYYGIAKQFSVTRLPCIDLIPWSRYLGGLALWVEIFTFLISAKVFSLFRQYDILYSREPFAGIFFSNIVLELHTLPKKVTVLHKFIWRRANALIVLTSLLKSELVQQGVDAKKILVAADGVDVSRFDLDISKEAARDELDLPQDRRIIVYTGSFYYSWKGVDVLIDAVEFCPENCLFVFVGAGKKEEFEIGKKLGSERVLIVGRQSHTRIPYYLKAADVLVLPNTKGEDISEKYTSPLKLFEYMSSGRPIVASDLPSIREVLSENNAILVSPNDPQRLSEGIQRVLYDHDFAMRIAKNAREQVREHTWEKRASMIIRFISPDQMPA